MKMVIRILLALQVFIASASSADDIEIYFATDAISSPYLLLVLDLRSSTFSTQVNRFRNVQVYDPDTGVTGENILTQDAYDQLVAFDNPGPNDKISVFQIFRAVLAGVLNKRNNRGEYAFNGIKVALSVSNNYDANTRTGYGGTLLEGYKLLGGTPDGRTALLGALGDMPGDLGAGNYHEFRPKQTYWEWRSYLNGDPVINDLDTANNFRYTHTPDFDPDIIDFGGLDPNNLRGVDPNTVGGLNFVSPFDPNDPDECPAMYSVIVAMQGPPPGGDDGLDTQIKAGFSELTANPLKIEDMLQYMNSSDADGELVRAFPHIHLNKTWVISDAGSIGATRDMAKAGRTGNPLSISDPVELEKDLENLFGEVLSVSSTFVAASVPVNVFNQVEALDNLYVALFEAQDTLAWPGNIKKLKLVDDPNDADTNFDNVVDVNGNPGFETGGPNKGRIYSTALTFWTDADALPPGSVDITDPNDPKFIPSGVDGRVVERGGAGQQIPGVIQGAGLPVIGDSNGANTRRVLLETATIDPNAPNVEDFSTSLKSDSDIQALFGVLDPNDSTASAAAAEELIRWGRGQDLDDDDGDGATDDARFWVLADAIHSRPFALNYGDTDSSGSGYDQRTNPDIVLYFGTGDGMFHGVRNTTSGDAESGAEVFGFYPREMLAQITRRRDDPVLHDAQDMRYGVDGEPVVLTKDGENDGNLVPGGNDEAYVYFGMRRGGYSYYALDVIDPNSPKLLWKITQTRTDTGDDSFDELGLTFSRPAVTKVKYGAQPVDALIFGGGYYGGWDPNDPNAPGQFGKDVNADDDAFGNAIYIVNAKTGELIWKATQGNASPTATEYQHPLMVDSIPSAVTVLETANGIAHRAYVGDTGGSIWRVDIPVVNETDMDNTNDRDDLWFVSRLADLTPGGEDLRFFHAPEVVEAVTEDGVPFDGVVIQSGNRADPLDLRFAPADNYIYYLRDYHIVSGDPNDVIPDTNDPSVPRYTSDDLADITGCPDDSPCETLNAAGWKKQLATSGEKGLSSPLVDAGRVFTTTYVPGQAGVCGEAAEGHGRLYVLDLVSGESEGTKPYYDLGPGISTDVTLVGQDILPGQGGTEPGPDPNNPGPCSGLFCKSLTERLLPIYWRQPGIDDL